ncbi:MAG TPA: hypothetical protein VFJ16_12925 [Longimicrobium sp.]|nr:hypothetical protein [Longimicrobium sp.]
MRLGKTKNEERSRAVGYQVVARSLLETAHGLDTLAEPRFGNGLAIVSVHAAIAYTDALTVAFRGIKSVDGDHTRAAEVLAHALGQRAEPGQVKRLKRVLNAKSAVSYGGDYYTLQEGREVYSDVTRYGAWAEEMLTNRP